MAAAFRSLPISYAEYPSVLHAAMQQRSDDRVHRVPRPGLARGGQRRRNVRGERRGEKREATGTLYSNPISKMRQGCDCDGSHSIYGVQHGLLSLFPTTNVNRLVGDLGTGRNVGFDLAA